MKINLPSFNPFRLNFFSPQEVKSWLFQSLVNAKVTKVALLVFSFGMFECYSVLKPIFEQKSGLSAGPICPDFSSVQAVAPLLAVPDHSLEKQKRLRVMQLVKPYFLTAYKEGEERDKKTRIIDGFSYSVERANHGLAHSLRQGAISRDIFEWLATSATEESTGIVAWARNKNHLDPQWVDKIEIAACFQRSGRQSECSNRTNWELYKKYENQDAVNFRNEVANFEVFLDDFDRRVFEESILWSNSGTLDPNKYNDLKFVRRILHASHLLDLRRIRGFNGLRIQRDTMRELFGDSQPTNCDSIVKMLWDRSGKYLTATGDRDLESNRYFQDQFFLQTNNPLMMVDAICEIRQKKMVSNRSSL